MMTTSPRLRIDLQATPVEDADGVLYYDVSDPKTGSILRLFDFEWLLAQRLTGQHTYEELVSFTEAQLGFSTTRADLEVYAQKLQQLGLTVEPPSAVAQPAPVTAPVAAPPEPVSAPKAPEKAPVAEPVAELPQRAAERPVLEQKRPEAEAPRAAAFSGPAAQSDDDGVMGRPVISLPAARPQQPAAKAATPVSGPVKKPVVEPSSGGRAAILDALEGLPPPEIETPAAAPVAAAPAAVTPPVAQAETPAVSPSETTPVKPPVSATPLASETTPVRTPETPAAEPAQAPEKAETKAPAEKVEAKAPAVVETPKPSVAQPAPPQEGGGGKWIFILLVVAALAAAGYYFLVYKPKQSPPAVTVNVSTAKVEDVARVFPTPAEVKKSDPQLLKIEANGTVTKVAAENEEVVAEAPLVVLDTQAKLEKELTDLKTRIDGLSKKVEAAKGKAKQDAQTKLDEKEAQRGDLEARLKKTQLVAPRAGVVAKVLVKVGDALTAGADAVQFADKALSAELKLAALETQGMKAGQDAKLTAGTPPNTTTVSAKLVTLKSEGDVSTLTFSLPGDATVKPGDKLSLQRGMLEKVVRLPAAAVIEGNKVYIVRDGKAAMQAVTVADRDGDSALVQGLSSGDKIILSRPPELHEGAPVQPSEQPESAAPAPTSAPKEAASPTAAPSAPAAPAQQ